MCCMVTKGSLLLVGVRPGFGVSEAAMSDTPQRADVPYLAERREIGQNFAMYYGETHSSIYADGIAGVIGNGAVSHVEFYVIASVTADPDPQLGMRERREIRTRVTMPTSTLLAGLVGLVEQMQRNLDPMQTGVEGAARTTAEQVQKLKTMYKALQNA
jgi:hypothetical protein